MTAKSEFQASLKAGRVNEAISHVVGNLVELDIVTLLPLQEKSSQQSTLSTKLDLLSGQITNVFSPEFLQDKSYAEFLSFHTAQIQATSQMVREQIQGLQFLLSNSETAQPAMPPQISTPTPTAAHIEAPKASTDTMPVQAPPIDHRLPSPEPPEIVSHVPAVTTTVAPAVALPAEVSPTSHSDSVPPAPEPYINQKDFLEKPAGPAAETEVAESQPVTPTVAKIERVSPVAAGQPAAPATSPPTAPLSAMSAAIAQAGALDISEANAIPNKLDQAFRFAGVKPDKEEAHPFDSSSSSEPVASATAAPNPPAHLDRELIDLLNEPDEQWDEWLLEEDAIFSELSQVSQEATQDKIPHLDEDWLAQPVSKGEDSGMDDWEKFIPEYTDPNPVTSKGQANVERFRQNLVNDPQLMNELLAELDDIEQLSEGQPPGKKPNQP